MALAALQQRGQLADKVAGFALAVCVLDQAQAGVAGALLDESTAKAATAVSAARGYLDGRTLAEVFAWLRPNDLIWNYWVNNYLQGKDPAPFDILFWNADTTRMTAALHRDFLDLALRNALVAPGQASMLGEPVDLSTISIDGYVVAGVADHICPWQACYRSAQLFGGHTRFVLSTSGHIAAIVNPPTNAKATHQVSADLGAEPAGVAARHRHDAGLLVARLPRLAVAAQRARSRRAARAGRSRAGAAGPRARRLRPRPMNADPARAVRLVSVGGAAAAYPRPAG